MSKIFNYGLEFLLLQNIIVYQILFLISIGIWLSKVSKIKDYSLNVTNEKVEGSNSLWIQKCDSLKGTSVVIKKSHLGQVSVTHACNPSYSGGRDQEDRGSKPVPGK
jgi:hypothetical protein